MWRTQTTTTPHDEDLALAAACASGDRNAIRRLETLIATDLEVAARRANGGLGADDLRQLLHQTLFLPREGRLRISDYAGRSSLRAWLRVVIARLVIDHSRKRSGREAPSAFEGAAAAIEDGTADPETQYLKHHYRRAFTRAFEDALASLSAEHRNLLRHRYAEGLSIDAIAFAHGVHRATAARRVSAAERTLHEDTRRRLAATLKLSPPELASIMRLIQSQMHVSVARLLG